MKEKPHWVAGSIHLRLYKKWVLLFTFENIEMKLNLPHKTRDFEYKKKKKN